MPEGKKNPIRVACLLFSNKPKKEKKDGGQAGTNIKMFANLFNAEKSPLRI